MKILTISNCPLIESQGSGYIIVNFTRGLQQLGHEVDVFGPEAYEPFQFLGGRAKSYRQALGMLFFCLRQIKKKRYDIIEFYGAEAWLTISVLHQLKNRSYLMISHSNGLETNVYEVISNYGKVLNYNAVVRKWYQLNQSALFSQAFTKVDGIITVSQYESNYALKNKYQSSLNIITIENSLLDNYLKINISFKRKPIIAYCGTWLTRKGIQIIKNDISKILTDFSNSRFKLIGVGNNFKKEENFPIEICNRIEVIPFVDNKDILKQIYQTVSILIMPSIYESFGLVSAEAMACGCALVANKTGFAASLKHREEAMLIDEPLSPYLYEAVKELLLNESLRMKIAQMGYERVQTLRWDLAIDKLEMSYSQWLAGFKVLKDLA
ncbi:glycosyltransferase family 4 protein [Nostoc sp. UHCC 0251]|uniref:glycosyltransferase family 4 protein n=1 Tax=Nostoc sp. UHCC 0251 TaxID=3110240 RepID=UPI002B1F825A|nr:glycosyltransferase family 4 protein [Nostoc sp. UHCC 0251]MEA5626095.1 glycosyltransferase family 4 protein [Nostoc sp. UHCC 0251]